jgi:hypothetical protein
MAEMKSRMQGTAGAWLLALSPTGYKVLGLLRKGCAYQVQGVWRFRGSHSPIRKPTIACLLAKGLAERVETEQHAQIRITEAGRSATRENALAASSAVRKPSSREADRVALTTPIFFFRDDAPGGLSGRADLKETLPSHSALSAANFAEVSRLTRAFGRIGNAAFRAAVIELAESWQKSESIRYTCHAST